ncbi:MAG: type transport system permease protein [Solirubrobacteraceae bacterium]|jgi:ABC-2 type transport system permease protein|nr:type transport system permease protein [Solirubrobacteraceae bacterium]
MSTTAVADPPPQEMPVGGQEVTGPSAFSGGLKRFVALTRTMAVQEFKLRFFGSVLGYLWQLMRPLMLFGVLFLMFTVVFSVSAEPDFGVALLLGIVLYTFFAEATGTAVTCVIDRENMVRKIQFPRMVIPMAVVLTACFNLVLNLVVVFTFGMITGVEPRWSWLGIVPLLALLVVFASGIAMMLSALYVRYRDVQPIWDVFLQVIFYGSLILVPYETVVAQGYEKLGSVLVSNPLAAVLQEARHIIVNPTYASASDAIGGSARLLIPLAIVIATFLLGLWVFNREAPRIAEEL